MTSYEKIFLFNALMGHKGISPDTPEFWSQIRNQTDRVVEEASEASDEAVIEDIGNLMKEVADVMVTSIGLFQKLQLCGVDISEVLDRVCDNNLTKFHQDADHANETVRFYQEKGIETFVRLTTMEDGVEFYGVLRKSDEKLLKPHDFVGVDISDIIEMTEKLAEAVGESDDVAE